MSSAYKEKKENKRIPFLGFKGFSRKTSFLLYKTNTHIYKYMHTHPFSYIIRCLHTIHEHIHTHTCTFWASPYVWIYIHIYMYSMRPSISNQLDGYEDGGSGSQLSGPCEPITEPCPFSSGPLYWLGMPHDITITLGFLLSFSSYYYIMR